jgi:hypothetical protein
MLAGDRQTLGTRGFSRKRALDLGKSLWFRIIDALPEILRDVESILIPITDRSDYSGSSWKCQIGVTRYVQKSQVKKRR